MDGWILIVDLLPVRGPDPWLFKVKQYCNMVKLENSDDRVHLVVTFLTS